MPGAKTRGASCHFLTQGLSNGAMHSSVGSLEWPVGQVAASVGAIDRSIGAQMARKRRVDGTQEAQTWPA